MKRKLIKAGIGGLLSLYAVFALEPNFVRSTTKNVDGVGSDVVSTGYTDGLGRGIQSKLKLGDDKDRVSCTYYDEAGRPKFSTKSFVDNLFKDFFLPGEIDNSVIKDQLEASNDYDTRAFNETNYWDDPLGRVKASIGPGASYVNDSIRTWTFGVGDEDVSFSVTHPTRGGVYSVHLNEGLIVSPVTYLMLDALNAHMLSNTVFSDPTYFLTVSKDMNGVYTQELKDIFGRTKYTRADPEMGTANDEILAEYEYDVLGNVLTEIPPKDNTTALIANTEYVYNTLGQLISRTSPDGGRVEYIYFPDGNVQFENTYEGAVLVRQLIYTYDFLGRPTYLKEKGPHIQIPSAFGYNNEREIATWAYDDLSTVSGRSIFKNIPETHTSRIENSKGRLSAVIYSNHGKIRTYVGELFSYDDEGRLRFKITAIEGMPGFQETWYEYDIHGKVTADFCFYGGEIIKRKYVYDNLGRLSEVYHCVTSDGGQTYTEEKIAGYTYDDLGMMQSKELSKVGGYDVGFDYDIRDRITEITRPSNRLGFEENISLYDKVGNIKNAQYNYFSTSSTAASDEFNMTYVYDDIYRLKTATPGDGGQTADYGALYGYDQVGRFNTIGKQEGSGSSDRSNYDHYTNTNRLKKTNNATADEYVYSTHGNLLVDYTKQMVIEYDWRDMPVVYRFYSAIPSGITKDNRGTCTNDNVYNFMKEKVDDGTIDLVSTVVMIYNAAGKRMGKMDIQE